MASAKIESKGDGSESESVVYKVTKAMERKEKGYKGQIAKLQADLAKAQAKSGHTEGEGSQNEPPQATNPHLARDYEKVCVDCGGENPNFKGPPNVFCHSGTCKGRIPMGHVEPSEVKPLEGGGVDLPTIKPCWNCGSDHDAKVEH